MLVSLRSARGSAEWGPGVGGGGGRGRRDEFPMDGRGDESLLSVQGRGREGGDQYVPAHLNRLQQVLVTVLLHCSGGWAGGSGQPRAAARGAGGRGGQMPLHFGGLCKLRGIHPGGKACIRTPSRFPIFPLFKRKTGLAEGFLSPLPGN